MNSQNRAVIGVLIGSLGVVAGTVIAVANGTTLVSAGLVADATGTAGEMDAGALALGILGDVVAIAGFMTAAVNFARWRRPSAR